MINFLLLKLIKLFAKKLKIIKPNLPVINKLVKCLLQNNDNNKARMMITQTKMTKLTIKIK